MFHPSKLALKVVRGRREEEEGLEEGNRGVMYRSKIRGMKHNVASSRESMTDIKRLQVVDQASRNKRELNRAV
jgi:hypothetical protein